jgi:hypothetical protein
MVAGDGRCDRGHPHIPRHDGGSGSKRGEERDESEEESRKAGHEHHVVCRKSGALRAFAGGVRERGTVGRTDRGLARRMDALYIICR